MKDYSEEESYEILKKLLEENIFETQLSQKALLHAIKVNDSSLINKLLKNNVSVDRKDEKTSITPLMISENIETIKLLIKQGANLNDKDIDGKTKLIQIISNYKGADKLNIIKLLLDKEAKVDITDNNKNTPLHYASRNDEIEIMKLLIEKGADVNAIGNHEITPLMEAVTSGSIEAVKLLIEKGAKTEFYNNFHDGILSSAQFIENEDMRIKMENSHMRIFLR